MKWNTYNTRSINSKYLYRYVSLEKLLHFLRTGSLYFSRMDSFEDNLEGIIPFEITKLIINMLPVTPKEARNQVLSDETYEQIKLSRNQNLMDLQKELHEKQKKRFVSCWFLGNTESIGMWDLYAKEGFLIRFDREILQNLVESKIKSQNIHHEKTDLLVAGKVKYQDFAKIPSDEKKSLIKYSGFRKHEAFKHEEEYRFIIHKSKPNELGLVYNLEEIDSLDFQIFTNPKMSKFTFNTYSDLLKKYTSKHKLKESMLKPWLEFKNTNLKNHE